jgi:glycosyltransferase involved in cell wall biosynthesis
LLAGLPVIASKVEGVVDVVVDGQSALLVEPNNARHLAMAISKLSKNEKLREDIGRVGQQRARADFSIDRMCNAYKDLIFGLAQSA